VPGGRARRVGCGVLGRLLIVRYLAFRLIASDLPLQAAGSQSPSPGASRSGSAGTRLG